MKDAKTIIKPYTVDFFGVPVVLGDDGIKAMEEYADQFKTMPSPPEDHWGTFHKLPDHLMDKGPKIFPLGPGYTLQLVFNEESDTGMWTLCIVPGDKEEQGDDGYCFGWEVIGKAYSTPQFLIKGVGLRVGQYIPKFLGRRLSQIYHLYPDTWWRSTEHLLRHLYNRYEAL